MLKLISLLYIFSSYYLMADDLVLKDILFLDSDLEISGMTKSEDNELLIVSDNTEDQFIYKVSPKEKKTLTTSYFAKLAEFDGFFKNYYTSYLNFNGGRWLKSPWDLEGLYRCKDKYYIVNEQVREVLSLDLKNKKIQKVNLDLTQAFKDLGTELKDISKNAGFEGIAINCETNDLYIAQERDPRAIFIYNLNTSKYLGMIKTERNPLSQLSGDYADLYFYNNFLYALERNEWRILKINPKTKQVINTFSFNQNQIIDLKKLYKTGEPYGLAEALYIDENEIIIGIDNNRAPISKRAEILLNIKGKYSSILYFKTPDNF